MLGLRLSISLSLAFYEKMGTLKIGFDAICVKSLVGLGSSSN